MASQLEIKRKKVELLRVSSAKAEMELRVHERMDEIERIKENISIQEAKELELAQQIIEMEKK